MKKFRYVLEPLLKIRKFQEKQEFSRYGRVLGEINRFTQKITDTKDLKNEFTGIERAKMLKGDFNLSDKTLAGKYYDNLALVIHHAEKEILSRKEESEALRKKAEKARLARKILEILKEKKQSVYQMELAKLQYKELDEFNSRKRKS